MGQASFEIGYVAPNSSSQATLSGPGVFSLSSRSNVPFVALVGRSGFYKVFSWGEIVEIPHQEQCTVKNVSFHGGDIYINGGADYDTRPARISVPVPIIEQGEGAGLLYTGLFPADVRMARRAYMMVNAQTLLVNTTVNIVGKQFDGSHNTGNEIVSGVGSPGSGYRELYELPSSVEIGPIPLGKRASYGDDSRPHALLTTAAVYFLAIEVELSTDGNAYYTLEY